MKQMVIISVALCPLLAGCAGGAFGPELSPAMARSEATELPEIRRQLRALHARVRSLKTRLSQHSAPPSPARTLSDREIRDINRRIAELEASGRHRTSGSARSGGPSLAVPAPDIERRISALAADVSELRAERQNLETKVGRLADAQAAGTTSQPNVAPPVAAAGSDVSTELAQLSERFVKLERGLDKDRSLVVDFLEDLDKRLAALEAAGRAPPRPGSPSAPTPPPQGSKP